MTAGDMAVRGDARSRARGRTRRAARWIATREHRGFVVAVVVGLALRLAWVFWLSTTDPIETTSDIGRNLAMADQFSRFQTYRLNGLVSAFNAPGYPLVLTPLAWLSRTTGWFSMPFAAAMVNVAAGTATVALAGILAGQWFGARASTAAAWIVAVAAGPIYLIAVALTETLFTALVLGVLCVVSLWLLRRPEIGRRSLVAMGLLIGFTALVRAPGLLLLVIVAIALLRLRGSWRAAVRPISCGRRRHVRGDRPVDAAQPPRGGRGGTGFVQQRGVPVPGPRPRCQGRCPRHGRGRLRPLLHREPVRPTSTQTSPSGRPGSAAGPSAGRSPIPWRRSSSRGTRPGPRW